MPHLITHHRPFLPGTSALAHRLACTALHKPRRYGPFAYKFAAGGASSLHNSRRPPARTSVRAMNASATAEIEKMKRPRRFAPLDPEKKVEGDERQVLEGIVFDVDGTLCLPQTYMFAQMREALDISKATDILDHIYALPEPAQSEAHEKVRAIEREAMTKQQPQEGLVELMQYLDERGVRKGICTRNFDAPVAHLLTTFLPNTSFTPIITRAFRPPKPSPAGILHIASTWNLPAATSLIMVGDSLDDMLAGHRAGAATVLLLNDVNADLENHECTDFVIRKLGELVGVLEAGFAGRDRENRSE